MVTRQHRIAALCAMALVLAAHPRPAAAQRIAEIQVAPRYLRMRQDAVTRVGATAYDAAGMPVDVHFSWRSSNINVAAVDSQGNVRALTPGVALVTAMTEESGRRRIGQVTVVVMPEPGPTRPGSPPPRGMRPPGMPPGTPPGMPPGPELGPQMARGIDSSVRASFDCNDPIINSVNPMHACWDQRAALRDSVVRNPDQPGPDVCPQGVSGVGLLLAVNDSGSVTDVRTFTSSTCPEFTSRVLAMARGLLFTPAQRGGKPVRAWVRLQVRARMP